MVSTAKTIVLIMVLTGLFMLDDVLIYFLLKNIYDLQVNLLLFGFAATLVIGLNLALALVVLKVMRQRPTTGQQGMTGKIGVVLKKIDGEGRVEVQGEIWRAESGERIGVGEKVVVEKMEGLLLRVKKLAPR